MLSTAILCLVLLETALSFHRTVVPSSSRHFIGLKSSTDDATHNWETSLRSPCKLNLFLRILGRRTTGFHDLASLFQAISFSDYMHFSRLPTDATCDEMTCSDTTLAVDNSNLVIKALNLMRQKTGVQQFFKVFLDKKVPMQAGLGGGSGNAATAMHAFNTLCGLPATLDEMKVWSGDIGSDITFFFSTGTAYCTGRGEIVTPLPALPDWRNTKVHVFKPKEGLSTALVFKALQLDACSSVEPIELLAAFQSSGALTAARAALLVNDLEKPAFFCNPDLLSLKTKIAEEIVGASGVMMSGSGTSIYAVVDSAVPADQVNAGVTAVLKSFPTVQHFESDFLNKENDLLNWY